MNAPKLRFKEFTDDWKSDKISNLTTYVDYRGKTPVKTETGIFLITAKNVKKGYIDYNCSKEYVEASQYNAIMHRGLPKVGDVLVTTEAPCGNVAQIDNANVALAQRIIKYRGNDLINNDFLKYELLSDYFQTELKRVASGGTVYGVKGSTLHQMSINYCSKEEQTKIAQFLSLLDKKIELQKRKIKALKLFKSYTKSEIFKNGNHVCKLGAILNKWNKKNKDGAINYVESISNKAGFIPQSEQFEYRNVASKNLRNYYVIKKGVFGYNPSRLNVGSLALKENDFISVVSPLYECFTTTQNNTYLFEWFNSNNFKKETFSKFEGGVRNTLNFNNLCDIPINLPDIETQNQYAKYFNKINFKISLEEQKLSELVKLKKGLLQEMFI